MLEKYFPINAQDNLVSETPKKELKQCPVVLLHLLNVPN